MYELQQGKSEAKIVKLAQQTGQKLPDRIANKPVLRVGLEIYWRAFWECSTDRDIGMAEGPIPWSAINAWGQRYGFTGEEFERLVLILKALDSEYIEERTKTHKKAMNKNMKSAGSTSGQKTKGPIRTKSRS